MTGVAGPKGGQGASVVAAALAGFAAGLAPTTLVTADPAGAARVLGAPCGPAPLAVAEGLWVAPEPVAGTVAVADGWPPGARRLAVVRGPCALALEALAALGPDSLVVVREPDRVLSPAEAAEAAGCPLAAVVPVSPAVARAVDAGRLLARLPRLAALAPLARLAASLVALATGQAPAGTDWPCPQGRTRRRGARVRGDGPLARLAGAC